MEDTYSTADVAAMAGVHRDTLLRWLRERAVQEPRRDRRGWRVFTARDAAAIVAFAKNDGQDTEESLALHDESTVERLEAIDWDFGSAKTGYLTHSIHPYPAKFVPQIPNTLIQELSSVGDTVADIFCGSGTTLLEALLLRRKAIGIDANPLATLISRAKTTPLQDSDFDELKNHRKACDAMVSVVETRTGDLFYDGYPFRSSGWRPSADVCGFWFTPHVVEELAELRRNIQLISSDHARRLCMVALAAIIVSVSKQDSDTRYVRRNKEIEPGDTVRRYLSQLDNAIRSVREMSHLIDDRLACRVLDCNTLDAPEVGPIDLVVTSPPYPNAYSYHLYHRTRLSWLGHDPESFKSVEIGSHRKYSSRGRNRATPETFRGEFESILRWLRERLRDRAFACFVVGNSTIGGEVIDNAELVVRVGEMTGFRERRRIRRRIKSTRKSFNPKIGKIREEMIVVLQRI